MIEENEYADGYSASTLCRYQWLDALYIATYPSTSYSSEVELLEAYKLQIANLKKKLQDNNEEENEKSVE